MSSLPPSPFAPWQPPGEPSPLQEIWLFAFLYCASAPRIAESSNVLTPSDCGPTVPIGGHSCLHSLRSINEVQRQRNCSKFSATIPPRGGTVAYVKRIGAEAQT